MHVHPAIHAYDMGARLQSRGRAGVSVLVVLEDVCGARMITVSSQTEKKLSLASQSQDRHTSFFNS